MRRATLFSSALLTSLALAGVLAHAGPLRLLGRAAADRSSAEPLRSLDLRAVLDGNEDLSGRLEAARELPDRCSPEQAIGAELCDDVLRCGWLASRAHAAAAWEARESATRRLAAEELHRFADRLAAGGDCGLRDEDAERWLIDRRAAAVDAAAYQLALLVESGYEGATPVVSSGEQSRALQLIRIARTRGVSGAEGDELIAARTVLRRIASRESWLDAQPGLDALRRLMVDAWRPLGGVPTNCGERLLDGDLLADQWRGMLVREQAPLALSCLAGPYSKEAGRAGLRLVDAEGAARLAKSLAERASGDSGGRTFGQDRGVERDLGRLAALIELRSPEAVRPERAPSAAAPRRRTVEPPPARATRPERAGQDRPAAKTARSRIEPAPSRSRLAPLIARASLLLGSDRGLTSALSRARDDEQVSRVAERLHIELHRDLCAPVADALPEDIGAARKVLARSGRPVDESACAETERIRSIRALLETAPELRALGTAAALRHAARLIAVGREREALVLIDRVPEPARGTTWAIVRAWGLRRLGDHPEASRTLATVDSVLIDELRTSGNDALARLVAHAWASPQR